MRMCSGSRSAMKSSMAAMVVDLPEPVTPARMTRPSGKTHNFSIVSGRPSSLNLGMVLLTRRAISDSLLRCLNRLTRKRVSSLPIT